MEISNLETEHGSPETGAGIASYDPGNWQHNCIICGRFTDRDGECRNVFQVEPGIWEHG